MKLNYWYHMGNELQEITKHMYLCSVNAMNIFHLYMCIWLIVKLFHLKHIRRLFGSWKILMINKIFLGKISCLKNMYRTIFLREITTTKIVNPYFLKLIIPFPRWLSLSPKIWLSCCLVSYFSKPPPHLFNFRA